MLPTAVGITIRSLQVHDFKAFLVGGCVRDMILKQQPKDWDIATSATPEEVMRIFPDAKLVGASFGVVNLSLPKEALGDPDHVEIATFRKDGNYSDGRRPDTVEFCTSAQEDSKRRDFTMNAMYYDPFNTWSPHSDLPGLLDFHHGLKDLRKGIIRCVGFADFRFKEDYLRMLRAIRFAVRFNFWLDPHTEKEIKANAAHIRDIVPERVAMELTGMMKTGRFVRALLMMDSFGILQHILPELGQLKGCDQPPEHHPEGDVWQHTVDAMSYLMEDEKWGEDPVVNWALLLHDIAKPATRSVDDTGRIRFNGHDVEGEVMVWKILRRLRYPLDFTERVGWIVENHMRVKKIQKMRKAKAIRFISEPWFEDLMAVSRYDGLSSGHDGTELTAWIRKQQALHPPEKTRGVTPLVTGDDLIAAGRKPGPDFKLILDETLNAQLEGQFADKEAALKYALDVKLYNLQLNKNWPASHRDCDCGSCLPPTY